jgi:rhomboid family GlyGly-CTERM serine protease
MGTRTLRQLFNAERARGWALLGVATLIGLCSLGARPVRSVLQYERSALAAGEVWRALTAHFVHLDAAHALVNVTGLALVWGIVIAELPLRAWLIVALVSALSVSAGLYAGFPQVQWYVGASGVLHGMLAAGVVIGSLRGDRVAWIALALLVAKLVYETAAGPLAFTEGKPVVTVSHALGAVGGSAVALVYAGARLARRVQVGDKEAS